MGNLHEMAINLTAKSQPQTQSSSYTSVLVRQRTISLSVSGL